MNGQNQTEFTGQPENPDLSIRAHEPLIRERQQELASILSELLESDWIESGKIQGLHSLVLQFDSAVFEPAALPPLSERDYRVQRVNFQKRLIQLEILEWEGEQHG